MTLATELACTCKRPTQWCCSCCIITKSQQTQAFNFVSLFECGLYFLPCTCHNPFCPRVQWKSNERRFCYFVYESTSSTRLSVHQTRSHCLRVTAAGLSRCLQGRGSFDENTHTHARMFPLTLPCVSLSSFASAVTHREKCAQNRTVQLRSATALPGLMYSIGPKQSCCVLYVTKLA